ncbi:type II toxin-antitoxin system HipA family toxin [Aeromicrobium sp. CF4.19]|uniref:type II toxin-antitoxin system HipA family toxin n=1 Tax=Aeromicrobium sp. CF4.19 TaxID=3373082 RepID=UPI003EE52C41
MTDDALVVQLQRPLGDWVDVGLFRSRNNTNWFEALDEYWDLPRRPVLGQVFEDRPREWKPSTRVALPHWFSHLLPEGRLRQAVASAAGVSESTELRLLAILGADDLPGAVRVLPWDQDVGAHVPEAVREELDEEATDPVLKFSLAGLQMKFSVQKTDRGLTVPISGSAGNMILKLPDARIGFEGVPEAEFAAMKLADEAGIRTPSVELVDANVVEGLGRWGAATGRSSFAVARFDRLGDDQRVHAEEFAQILHIPTARAGVKYTHTNFEAVANVSARLAGVETVGEVIDRIVLNVLVGNGDAHLKNWSMFYPDGMNPALSPVYDVVPTVLYVENDDLGLNLNGSKKFTEVNPKSFERMGAITEYGADAARERAREASERVLEAWSVLSELLPEDQRERLTRRLSDLPLAKS